MKRLFESIIKTTSNCGNIEIILYLDEDDLESHKIHAPEISLKKVVKPREKMGKVVNLCCKASKGKCLININDDVIFRTQNWELLILDKIKSIPDEVYLFYANDLRSRKGNPTFPVISRKTYELMDGFSPDDYIRFFIETHYQQSFLFYSGNI